MLIMREFDRELPQHRRFAKSKSRVVTGRSLQMTTSANHRTRAFEKLWPVTSDTSIVIGIISRVRKVSNLLPVRGWKFVARLAGLLVLICGVREL